MKEMLSPFRLNELLCCSSYVRRAERLSFLCDNAIADAECHVLSSGVGSTLIHIQPASRIIHTSWMSFNRGAAGDNFVSMRSGDITLELTGRDESQ